MIELRQFAPFFFTHSHTIQDLPLRNLTQLYSNIFPQKIMNIFSILFGQFGGILPISSIHLASLAVAV
jgi:hypothetical protein